MKMKKAVLFALVPLFISCASIEYNMETKTLKYWRVGNQELQGLTISAGAIQVSLDNQKSQDEEIREILTITRKLLEAVTP
jgi:hypothetical protein